MFVKFNIRRRPDATEENIALNAYMLRQLSQISGFFGGDKDVQKLDVEKDDSSWSVHLSDPHDMLVEGLFGQMRYAARYPQYNYRDEAMYDDHIIITLDTDKIDYANFCRNTILQIISVFQPYRINVETNKQLSLVDWEITSDISRRTGTNSNGRDGVYRIWPIAYYDDLLCQRAFKLSAEEVVERVAPECEHAELINNGAFLIVTSEVVTDVDALEALNTRIRTCLAV